MAENQKAVQRRIKAVKNTQQITKAMKMVAAAKLRRAQEKVLAARPYSRELAMTLGRLMATGVGTDHPVFAPREDAHDVAYVVMTGDRGLAGSFNVNVIRTAQAAMDKNVNPLQLVAVGRKGRDHFIKRGIQPALDYSGFGEEPSFALARDMLADIMKLYTEGSVGEVRLIFMEFINPVMQRPKEVQLLPILPPEPDADADLDMEYIYVPDVESLVESMAKRYIETLFYQALLESKASEHGARMTAMGNATDNATDMIDKLTLAYNRARQAGITREISEIVGGANALQG